MTPPVILYRYAQSPYARKIENTLTLKGVPYCQVNVSSTIPRPELGDLLGIGYRRIPVLAIGRDVYCDTSLLVTALEKCFPPSAGFGTIFPKTKNDDGHVDTGLVKLLSRLVENDIFPLAVNLLSWKDLPQSFIQDRASYFRSPINIEQAIAGRGEALSTLSSHIQLLEEQLSDGREWLFNTELPGLADISCHFVLSWMLYFPTVKGVIATADFPRVFIWLDRFSTFLDNKRKKQSNGVTGISGDQAAEIITSSTYLDPVRFDHKEATRLGLTQHESVLVTPTDTGVNHPTIGKLISLDRSEVVIEVTGSRGPVRCHFPRFGFTVRSTSLARL